MIWVIGNKGMLGQELCIMLEAEKIPFTGTDREVSILDKEALASFSAAKKPTFIVNCSGYTAVDKAEEDTTAAFALNRDGAAAIAALAGELGIPLLHISTDYVFPGTSPSPLEETAETGPAGVYGKSKLAGEEAVRERCPKHFIIRTAWLYGQYGPNFVYTMLKLMNSHESIKVVNDQHGSPTWTRDLASLIIHIIKTGSTNYGTYHFSGEGECTWYDFAREIYRLGRSEGLITTDCTITPCSSDEYPTPAKRPEYSLLSKEKVKKSFGFPVPNWKESLKEFMVIRLKSMIPFLNQ